MTKKKKYFSIKWKLLLVSVFLVTVPTISLGVLSYKTLREEAYKNVKEDLAIIVKNWQITTKSYIDQMDRVLRREEVLVEKSLGFVSLDAKKMIALVKNSSDEIWSKEEIDVLFDIISDIRISRSGYVFVVGENGKYFIDKKKDNTGKDFKEGLISSNKDLWDRIIYKAKNLKGDDQYFIEHYQWQDSDSPKVRNRVTAFTYLPDLKLIVGACTYYTDFKSYELKRILREELTREIARESIGKEGYIWVINSNGEYIVSKDRLRDGENIILSRDEKGAYFIKDIIDSAKRLNFGDVFSRTYFWKNVGENKPQKRLSYIGYVKEWDWIIGASAYHEDFLSGLEIIKIHILIVCFIFIVLGSLVAYLIATFISAPIQNLERISILAASGNLDVDVHKDMIDTGDEIERLADSFGIMINHLKTKMQEIEKAKDSFEVSNISLVQEIKEREKVEVELLQKNKEILESERTLKNLLAESQAMHKELKDAQSQLLQAEKLAAIGQLAAGVAHEVNNPAGFIKSNLYVLHDYMKIYNQAITVLQGIIKAFEQDNMADARKHVEVIQNIEKKEDLEFIKNDVDNLLDESKTGIERIRKIVLDLKSYARESSNEMKEESISDIIEQALNIVWNEIKYKAQVKKYYGKVPKVICNAQKISQVIINILINAAQAIEDQGLIVIKTYFKDGHVCVEISDNGEGIEEKDIKNIFDPFFTTKPVGKGTGLGLNVAYDIVKMHEGTISVDSKRGSGTTFTVSLPLNKN
ncbi:MAG: hypothetical protein A2243_07385 [Omnitrophica WOR_2 bacterium RIFOXYA2_FULL_38_17]|nr:MAG: hypothetical protein A2243_07385 [Omnitrophica WOR_2 bacterium RIFOXYA2_FULL_38_17]HBG61157.1 hypothetical protein [Candidatus Omnitrophota bacterium]